MMKNVLIPFCLLLLTTFNYTYSFLYNGRIISEGDRKIDVLSKCGEPSYKETRREEQKIEKRFLIKNIQGYGKNNSKDSNNEDTSHTSYITVPLWEKKTDKDVEEWIYNFGPSDFVQILSFEEDNLVKIEMGNYGYEEKSQNTLSVPDKIIISEGDTKFDILSKYGKPTLTNSSVEEIINNTEEKKLLDGTINLENIKDSGKNEFSVYIIIRYINIDEWAYDFGKNRFCKILTFKNGRLTDIKNGEFGIGQGSE
ncbi:MAG: DUF2845 domain-containing protein [bacterium]